MGKESKELIVKFGSIPFFTIFVIFTTLKVAGVIGWSWWIVTCPLWGPIAALIALVLLILLAGLGVLMVVAIFATILAMCKSSTKKSRV
jgi:hypothetical protein